MKKKTILLLMILACFELAAQYNITLSASILDKSTNEPIPFTNVAIKAKYLNAVTDMDGKLELTYDEELVTEEDIIEFSNLGYEKLEVKVGLLYKLLMNSDKIFMKPKPFAKGANSGQANRIMGIVKSESGPIQGARVSIKNTFIESKTNADGEFSIKGSTDDVLVVKYLGMRDLEVLVSDAENMVIEMQPDGELLEEVYLEGQRKAEEIETATGKKTEDAVGYSVTTINNEDFPPGAIRLVDIIRGRFAGVTTQGFGDDASFILRGKNSLIAATPAIFDVDGMIYTETPSFLDITQIESISILRSLASVNRYGAIARGGVIKIKMKYKTGLDANGQPIDQALVTGNDYDELTPLLEDVPFVDSDITKKLKATRSFEDAKQVYESEKANQDVLSIPFLLDASDYFQRWDEEFSNEILKEIAQIAYYNPKALKALAYKLEEKLIHEEAKLVYQRIAVLRPNDVQSYRDLALSYVANGNYQEAMTLYKQMLANDKPNVDFSAIESTIINEIKHLVANHRQEVNYKDLHPDLLSVKFKSDVRFVFDWNDPNSEFEFQFVNPQKKFYTWAHTKFDNMERMTDEIQKGYHTEEYIIDDADKGEWIINIRNLSEEDTENPTYLKYTVYTNYGLPDETKEVKVVKLYQLENKVTLDKFKYKG
ncbi:MAG: TonB-dependent receptor plug domain-containing protein [Flavobacteriaceae bacterium]|nr:TonB-dependent receptor plug domain-containing protein [Flavobacteriaceae bacterium]